MIILLGIIIAGITGMAIGFVWYHPKVFGTTWMRLSGMTPAQVSGGMQAQWATFAGFVAAIVMAGVLYLQILAEIDLVRMLLHTTWLWLGFIAPVLLNSVLWERRPLRLYAINASYWLVVMLVMTLEFYFILT